MAKEQHTLTISPDGTVTIAVSGVKGKSCTALTADLEKALGVTSNNTPTREYYESESTNTVHKQ